MSFFEFLVHGPSLAQDDLDLNETAVNNSPDMQLCSQALL